MFNTAWTINQARRSVRTREFSTPTFTRRTSHKLWRSALALTAIRMMVPPLCVKSHVGTFPRTCPTRSPIAAYLHFAANPGPTPTTDPVRVETTAGVEQYIISKLTNKRSRDHDTLHDVPTPLQGSKRRISLATYQSAAAIAATYNPHGQQLPASILGTRSRPRGTFVVVPNYNGTRNQPHQPAALIPECAVELCNTRSFSWQRAEG